MKKDFSYAVVSSVLHDKRAVEEIFSAYEPFFAGLSGHRVELGKPSAPIGAAAPADDAPPGATAPTGAAPGAAIRAVSSLSPTPPAPPFFFILTGGTEGIVLEYLSSLGKPSGKPFPLVLVAHPRHNSLPAALEIAARARQDGGSAILILVKSPSDDEARRAVEEAVLLCGAVGSMRASRIGAIGKPSDWLVASSQTPASVASTWGATMEVIALSELRREIDAVRASAEAEVGVDADAGKAAGGALSVEAAGFLEKAAYRREPNADDMSKSDDVYRALRSIAAARHLDGLSLRCFDLVNLDRSTGCFALSQLADEGIDAGCEGDVPSIIALRWMRLLSGKAAWMANPADISLGGKGKGEGRLLLAHCTVPRTLLTRYGIRSHFESGLGVAVAGTFAPGPVTVVRLGGIALDQAWIAEGIVRESPSDEGLCRTQALLEMEEADLEKLLEHPLGNHLVVAFGHWKRLARRYLALERIGEI